MSQFAPKHLSEKLQAAGLVSDSGFYCPIKTDQSPVFINLKNDALDLNFWLQAYTLLDLIGPSEQARANAVKWWGCGIVEVEVYKDLISKITPAILIEGTAWKVHRHALIDLNSDAAAWEYVERTGVVK